MLMGARIDPCREMYFSPTLDSPLQQPRVSVTNMSTLPLPIHTHANIRTPTRASIACDIYSYCSRAHLLNSNKLSLRYLILPKPPSEVVVNYLSYSSLRLQKRKLQRASELAINEFLLQVSCTYLLKTVYLYIHTYIAHVQKKDPTAVSLTYIHTYIHTHPTYLH